MELVPPFNITDFGKKKIVFPKLLECFSGTCQRKVCKQIVLFRAKSKLQSQTINTDEKLNTEQLLIKLVPSTQCVVWYKESAKQ